MVHLHLKDKGHALEDNTIQILNRDDRWLERGIKEAMYETNLEQRRRPLVPPFKKHIKQISVVYA